jgi:hypothetical protein
MCAEGVSISLDDANSAWHCQTDRDRNRQEARHVPRAPKEQNLRLRSLLDEAAMSNKGLARRVVDLAATWGLADVRCDHTSVLRWLAGEQPRPPVPELAAEVLTNALGRKVSETELGMVRTHHLPPPAETSSGPKPPIKSSPKANAQQLPHSGHLPLAPNRVPRGGGDP